MTAGLGITPTSDHLLVEWIEQEDVTSFGLIIPETAKEKPDIGIVLAAGPGKLLDNGKLTPMTIAVGDKILYLRYAGTQFEVDRKKYLMLSAGRDVLGVFDPAPEPAS